MHWSLKRIGQSVLTAVGVITITFALIRFLPGGPMRALLAQLAQEDQSSDIDRLEGRMETMLGFNPNEPLLDQYVDYVSGLMQGDLGVSLWYDAPVAEILATALPWTVFVMLTALLINFVGTILLGAMMAYKEGGRFDLIATTYSLTVSSIPYYIIGLILIFVLAIKFPIFPSGGRMPNDVTPGLNTAFVFGIIYHATLPIASFAFTRMGRAITMRANSIQILGEDYVRVSRLRGLPTSRIATRYVGWNAILPLYTGIMIGIGVAFGGSVILEVIFSYPGVGYYMFEAIQYRDYPLMMGGFLVITLSVVFGLFVADITYGLIDPRIRTENEG